MKIETPKEPVKTMITEKHEHKFVPLYLSIIVFVLIVLAYIYCAIMGIEVNPLREIGVIGISGIIMSMCVYLNNKEN
jgi:hypothetical protein